MKKSDVMQSSQSMEADLSRALEELELKAKSLDASNLKNRAERLINDVDSSLYKLTGQLSDLHLQGADLNSQIDEEFKTTCDTAEALNQLGELINRICRIIECSDLGLRIESTYDQFKRLHEDNLELSMGDDDVRNFDEQQFHTVPSLDLNLVEKAKSLVEDFESIYLSSSTLHDLRLPLKKYYDTALNLKQLLNLKI